MNIHSFKGSWKAVLLILTLSSFETFSLIYPIWYIGYDIWPQIKWSLAGNCEKFNSKSAIYQFSRTNEVKGSIIQFAWFIPQIFAHRTKAVLNEIKGIKLPVKGK